jgi:4-amino-4-deoxy-L-arabinose transferase-like glycosyltransferase
MRREDVRNLLLLTLLAALVRIPTLGHQSFDHDEAITAGLILHPSLIDTMRAVGGETSPPLFYGLEWLVSKLFGTGETSMRLVSALAGTAVAPVTYELTRALVSRRAALVAGALMAVSPFLLWYSQEARPYALLVLLSAVSLLLLVKALESPTRLRLAGWAAACAAAFATHWFAGFLIAPEALWLLLRCSDRRGAVAAVAGAGAAMAVLLPLLIHQNAYGGAGWIATIDLGYRLRVTGEEFLAGFNPRWVKPAAAVAACFAVAGLALLLLRADGRERRGGLLALAMGAAVCALPLALALVGHDVLISKNLLPAFVPLAVAVAAGLGARRAGVPGLALAGALLCLSLVVVVIESTDEGRQRWDVRGAAEAMGRPASERAVVVPYNADVNLAFYLPEWRRLDDPEARVSEVVVLGRAKPGAVRLPSGFREIEQRKLRSFEMARYRARRPLMVSRRRLATTEIGAGCIPNAGISGCEQGVVLLERPSG